MILKPKYNLPSASVSTTDAAALLASYQEWSGNASATIADLYEFITTPSSERKEFISTLTLTGTASAKYIIQQIS